MARGGGDGSGAVQQVALDQREEVRAQFVGERLLVAAVAGEVVGVFFCFHRP